DVEGHWFGNDRLDFRPEKYWKEGTKVTVDLDRTAPNPRQVTTPGHRRPDGPKYLRREEKTLTCSGSDQCRAPSRQRLFPPSSWLPR
ncbi:Ig-like domain-containing protein, partial [Streptomyces sp. NPDC046881]|uniref:Ig-like domain-containing protein n=1 Tax=Streptomyces sp. NPDC046881 TaxID=3155374 RepID=UPI0033CC9D2B